MQPSHKPADMGTIKTSLMQQDQTRKFQPNDVKQKLDGFTDADCPVLRTARMGDITKMKLDSACGIH
jgi:hypothetical protein